MRSRGFAPIILVILVALLAACAPLPSVLAPTAAPVTAPTTLPTPATEVTATVETPLAPTDAAPIAPTLEITETISTPAEVVVTPTITETITVPVTPVVTTDRPQDEPASGNTYRDESAGFELDYPVAWSVIDVTPEIKQQSLSYSVTFMSWAPQEPGTQGIPEGGSKIDVSVTKGAAATPEAAVESRRQEIAQGDPGSQITFEEPWEFEGGLAATHWTVQTASGEVVHEVVTAINGNLILISGLGDALLFEQVAMTLRPLASVVEALNAAASTGVLAVETPEVRAMEPVTVPMAALESGSAASAAAVPLAATVYTVRQGDTLARIAARYSVTVAAILRANPQITNPDRIYVGQRITIPTSGGTQPPAGTTRVNIYMIGIGGGSVGCGDQVVAVRRDVPRTAAPLTAALNLMLSQKSQYYGESGLYNALYQSDLRIASITRSGNAWTIRLTGTLRLGGVCDAPRVRAQLEQTALQFSTVQSVRYFINGQSLETVLSGQ